MNWQRWMRGLLGAVINSAASATTVVVVDPGDFNFAGGLGKLGSVIAASAIVGAALYLKTHPLPEDE